MSQNSKRWSGEAKAVGRAVKSQIHFDFTADSLQALKSEAACLGVSPSDVLRTVLGLNASGSTLRPRVGVSFSEEERTELASGLGLEPEEGAELKRRCQDKINQYFNHKKSSGC